MEERSKLQKAVLISMAAMVVLFGILTLISHVRKGVEFEGGLLRRTETEESVIYNGKVRGEQVEITVKYEGYIRRQEKQVEEFEKLERRRLPPDMDYSHIQGLRLEAREKLAALRPENLGQAGRISGVSPADIAALMVYLHTRETPPEGGTST